MGASGITCSTDTGTPNLGTETDGGSAHSASTSESAESEGSAAATTASDASDDQPSADASTGADDDNPTIAECNDGIDNDGDGLVDWQLDLGCVDQTDTTEGGAATLQVQDGWTVFEPSADTRIVYVSSSEGDDGFDGLAPEPDGNGAGPVASLAAAAALIRSNSADWLLLRRGDEWDQGLGAWSASGRSPTEPVVVASYGESVEAPRLRGDTFIAGMDGAAGGSDNVAITHLRFEGAGISSLRGSNILIEGCQFALGAYAIVVEGTDYKGNWRIRRNTVDRTTSNAIYVNGVDGVLLEGNVIYRPAQDEANHAMYITRRGNDNVEVRDNAIFMGKETGNAIMMRPGGIASGNVIVDFGWSGVSVGACDDGDGGPCFDPVHAVVTGNVFLEAHRDIGTAIHLSDGFVLPGAEVTDNIVAGSSSESFNALSVGSGVDGLRLENNIFRNATSVALYGPNRDMQWRDNVWSNDDHDLPLVSIFDAGSADGLVAHGNRFFASVRDADRWFELPTGDGGLTDWQSFCGEVASGEDAQWVDEARTLASYSASVDGEGSAEAFFVEALGQRKFAYRAEYGTAAIIEYFREGFRSP